MANTDRICGFRPVRHLNGNPWNGKARMYYIPSTDSTATFVGDTVKSHGSADASGKHATVIQAAAGDNVRGVVIMFCDQPYMAFDTTNLYRAYRPADTAMYCLVVDDPDVIFEVQEDNADNNIDADMIGLSANFVVGSGNTSSGLSGMELDSSGTGAGEAGCKILNVSDKEDNDLGTYCKFDVLLIQHEMRLATGV